MEENGNLERERTILLVIKTLVLGELASITDASSNWKFFLQRPFTFSHSVQERTLFFLRLSSIETEGKAM